MVDNYYLRYFLLFVNLNNLLFKYLNFINLFHNLSHEIYMKNGKRRSNAILKLSNLNCKFFIRYFEYFDSLK